MATPTQQVTRHAQAFLDQHDVVLALRVEWGAKALTDARSTQLAWSRPPWSVLFVPVMKLWQLPSTVRRVREEPAVWGILALTADASRIVLSTSPWMPKRPIGVNEVLPQGSSLLIDVGLMETELIPLLEVGERQFVVNGVDFRALLKAIEAGTISAPEIELNLDRLKAIGQKLYG